MYVSCECCVLSGRNLCVGLISRRRGVLPSVVYVIECDQVQQYDFTSALSRQKSSDKERDREKVSFVTPPRPTNTWSIVTDSLCCVYSNMAAECQPLVLRVRFCYVTTLNVLYQNKIVA
jgi:hypothetical protein